MMSAQEGLGPVAYQCWHRYLRQEVYRGTIEVPIYSDSSFTGSVEPDNNGSSAWGPFSLFNTISMIHSPGCLPVFILRIEQREDDHNLKSMEKTDTESYHGGDWADEIASMIGLATGTRMRASSVIRHLSPGNTQGRPQAEDPLTIPYLPPRHSKKVPRIETPTTPVELPIDFLRNYPKYKPDEAITLVRAAHQYQNALWLCENSPEYSWLMLVSAVEVVADYWRQSDSDDPVAVFQRIEPRWYQKLQDAGNEELVRFFAKEWKSLIKATNRFIKFLLTFLPEPPVNRPEPAFRIDWTPNNLETGLKRIYKHRSTALHGGIPFPDPLCDNPKIYGQYPFEKPPGLATSSNGGVWLEEDLPMCLHVFAYIVRGALLNWWKTIDQRIE